ncbi:MAG: hypothetical protein WBX25_06175 [Rhodomicrobium sp.]
MKPNSKPSTLRMRRYRERRAIGAIALPPQDIERSMVRALVNLRWLDPDKTGDPKAINDAIMSLLFEALYLGLRGEKVNRVTPLVTA